MGKICRAVHPDPLALGGGELVADALTDNFALELRERGISPRATRTASLVAIAMKAAYRQAIEPSNESAQITF